jgi:hypothetical protein
MRRVLPHFQEDLREQLFRFTAVADDALDKTQYTTTMPLH